MAMAQLLIRLPEELARRFKRNVSVRQRSRFIERLLDRALPPAGGGEDDPVHKVALAVERDQALTAEMTEWETAAIADGFDDSDPSAEGRRERD